MQNLIGKLTVNQLVGGSNPSRGAIVFPNVYAGLSTMASKKSYLPNFVGATLVLPQK